MTVKFKFLVIIIYTLFIQCGKNDEEILFKMEYDQVLNLPAGLNTLETYSFLLRNLNTNFSTLATTFNVSPTGFSSVRPGSVRLNDDLNQLDFGRIERISLLASKPDFVNEIEIAYLEPVPPTSTNSLQLFPTLVDAAPIFTGEKFNLKLKIKLRGFVTSNTNIRLRLNMNVIK